MNLNLATDFFWKGLSLSTIFKSSRQFFKFFSQSSIPKSLFTHKRACIPIGLYSFQNVFLQSFPSSLMHIISGKILYFP